MDANRAARITGLVARMAAGDPAAMVTMLQEFAGPIRRTVARQFRHFNVLPSDDQLEEAMVDTGLLLFDLAPGWRPDGGAMPWRWAEMRIRAAVGRLIGQHATDLDDAPEPAAPELAGAAVADDPDLEEVLARHAAHDRRAALVLDALRSAVSERHAAVLLAYRDRKAAGDPSPAESVGAMYGLSPQNVRQIASRSTRKVLALIEADDRFAELRDDGVFGS